MHLSNLESHSTFQVACTVLQCSSVSAQETNYASWPKAAKVSENLLEHFVSIMYRHSLLATDRCVYSLLLFHQYNVCKICDFGLAVTVEPGQTAVPKSLDKASFFLLDMISFHCTAKIQNSKFPIQKCMCMASLRPCLKSDCWIVKFTGAKRAPWTALVCRHKPTSSHCPTGYGGQYPTTVQSPNLSSARIRL